MRDRFTSAPRLGAVGLLLLGALAGCSSSPGETPTPSATATVTPTPSATATVTPTPSATATVTPTPTPRPTPTATAVVDADQDGSPASEDCDDANDAAYPGASEICDGEDNNCDGTADEGVTQRFYVDGDGDGVGDAETWVDACTLPEGHAETAGDCDDANASAYPGAVELCDTIDNDCDRATDERVTTTFYADQDGDGYGAAKGSTEACAAPEGYVPDSSDCDDTNADAYPEAAEACDAADNDCDGQSDEGVTTTFYVDQDGDGFGDAESTTEACAAPEGYVSDSRDCDDARDTAYFGAPELCDGVDNDCDAETDEGVETLYFYDDDSDGHGDLSESLRACEAPDGYVLSSDDCDDGDALAFPGALEIPINGVDEDCDGEEGRIVDVSAGSDHTLALDDGGYVWAWGYGNHGQLGGGDEIDRPTPTRVPGLSGVIAVRAGGAHSVALLDNGALMAWGHNALGQLGDGTFVDRSSPVAVPGLTNVEALFVGGEVTFARRGNGEIYAWGGNGEGQLGDGTQEPKNTPTLFTGVSEVSELSAGQGSSFAIDAEGVAYVWGDNTSGQLGVGNTSPQLSPVALETLNDVVFIGGGDIHALALTGDGTFYAWGSNLYGSLGDDIPDTNVPVQIPGLGDQVQVAVGLYHTLALQSDGTVLAWGRNNYGQIGTGGASDVTTPTPVRGLSDAAAVVAGGYHSSAILTDGSIVIWGRNEFGQIGDGSLIDARTPRRVLFPRGSEGTQCDGLDNDGDGSVDEEIALPTYYGDADGDGYGDADARLQSCLPPAGYVSNTLDCDDSEALAFTGATEAPGNSVDEDCDGSIATIVQVAGGSRYGIALDDGGHVWSWGANFLGNLGNGTTQEGLTPARVPDLEGVVAISAGEGHVLALLEDGTVKAWGNNRYGSLGDGTNENRLSPVDVLGLSNVERIWAGRGEASFAQLEDGSVYNWGYNGDGNLCEPAYFGGRNTPAEMTGLSDIVDIGMGLGHTIFRVANGSLYGCGYNYFGQLGDGTNVSRAVPTLVSGVSISADIDVLLAGERHNTLIVSGAGDFLAIGDNQYGQLGNGTGEDTSTALTISETQADLKDLVDIAPGLYHSAVLLADGTVRTWGRNNHGQIGNDTLIDQATPFAVEGLEGVVAIGSGHYSTFALMADGALMGWGQNTYGGVGTGTTEPVLTPSPVLFGGQ